MGAGKRPNGILPMRTPKTSQGMHSYRYIMMVTLGLGSMKGIFAYESDMLISKTPKHPKAVISCNKRTPYVMQNLLCQTHNICPDSRTFGVEEGYCLLADLDSQSGQKCSIKVSST